MKFIKLISAMGIIGFSLPVLAGLPKQNDCWKVLLNPALSKGNKVETGVIAAWLKELGLHNSRLLDEVGKSKEFHRFVEDSAKNWNELNPDQKRELAFQYIEDKWQHFRHISNQQRTALLYLDLVKLGVKPNAADPATPYQARETLQALSARNLEQLLETLKTKASAVNISPSLAAKIDATLSRTSFQFIKSFHFKPKKVHAPILPERELTRMGLNPDPSFWNQFMSGATSVGLEVAAVRLDPKHPEPIKVSRHRETTDVVVDTAWVETQGFAIPAVARARDLLTLFSAWRPDLLQKFLSDNRNYLSSEERDPDKLLNPSDEALDHRFPAPDPNGRLLPLRQQMWQFALTVPDLQVLMREIMRLYIQDLYGKSTKLGDSGLLKAMDHPYDLLSSAQLRTGMSSGWLVRIPGAIPTEKWTAAGDSDSALMDLDIK